MAKMETFHLGEARLKLVAKNTKDNNDCQILEDFMDGDDSS